MQPVINPPEEIEYKVGRILRIKSQGFYCPLSERIPKIITISRLINGEIWGSYSYGDELGRTRGTKKRLDRDRVELLLLKLRRARISASPEFERICDAGIVEIEIGDEDGKAIYSWSGDVPVGWEELGRIIDSFEKMMRAK